MSVNLESNCIQYMYDNKKALYSKTNYCQYSEVSSVSLLWYWINNMYSHKYSNYMYMYMYSHKYSNYTVHVQSQVQ